MRDELETAAHRDTDVLGVALAQGTGSSLFLGSGCMTMLVLSIIASAALERGAL